MNLMNFLFLLEADPVIVGGQGSSTAAAAATEAAGAVTDAAQGGSMSLITMILLYAAVFAALYFFMIRPQRKRDKEAKEMQGNIRPGDNVVTTSGFYGKVMDVGEDVFIIEFGTNRGIRVPVRKSDVAGIKDPKLTPAPTATKE